MRFPALTALRVIVGSVAVAAVLVIVLATAFIVGDESDHSDDWDGIGTFLGLLALAGAVPILGLMVVAFILLRRRIRAGLVLTGACGLSLIGCGVVIGLHLGEWWMAVPAGLIVTGLTAIAWKQTTHG